MKILGIDYGKRRIGLAVSDDSGLLARGLQTLDRRQCPNVISVLQAKMSALNAHLAVVGYPYRQDGSKGTLADEVEAFAAKLRQSGVSVRMVDESFSSEDAIRELRIRKKRWTKGDVDRVAACHILQSYLDAEHHDDDPS